MNVEIITIGDELLIGQVVDTNSAWMGQQLNRMGWEVLRITSVRDRAQEIATAIDSAFSRVDVVLMTGGLGPTKDDITKQTLCLYFGGEMIFDEVVFAHVKALVAERGFTLNDSTSAQAWVPSSCRVIQNNSGTAPVMWFEKGDKVLVSMPGVPVEMKQIMQQDIIPALKTISFDHSAILHETCLVINFTESALSEFLEEFEAAMPEYFKLAYLPTPGVIRLRLTARGEDEILLRKEMDFYFSQLLEQIGESVICREDQTLAGALGMLLTELAFTLSTAESCTGGNIAHEITRVAGSSAYYCGTVVAYTNELKRQLLGVKQEALDTHGAVSIQVVEQMAVGAAKVMHSHCAIATSGIAGPTGATETKPVGTICIATQVGDEVLSTTYFLGADREQNIQRFTHVSLLQLIKQLIKCKKNIR